MKLLGLSLLLLLALVQQSARASIYPVASELWIPAFQKTEKMFATDQGPVFARTGNSSITVRRPLSLSVASTGLGVLMPRAPACLSAV